ncbi:MAG: hypothetical protein IJ386_04360 [Clostridia bacterium]|nr:hypothetical protein [Clostridia bacterium]
MRTEKEYDSHGRVIKETSYHSNGAVKKEMLFREDGRFREAYEYYSDGKLFQELRYDERGSIALWYDYEYDHSDRVTKKTEYYPNDTVKGYTVYEYTDDGKMLTVEHKYNSEGDRTGRICRDSDGNMLWYSRLEYYPNDWIKKETYYYPEGRVLYWEDFEIDEDKMAVTMTRHLPDGTVETEEYKYDSDGNVT